MAASSCKLGFQCISLQARLQCVCCFKSQEKKVALTGSEIFTQRATHLAYDKRADAIKPDLTSYSAAKEQAPDRALEIDPMEYGKEHEVREQTVVLFRVCVQP